MEAITTNIFNQQMTMLSRVSLTTEELNSDNVITVTIGYFLNPQIQSYYQNTIQSIRMLCPNLDEKKRNKATVDDLKKSLPAGIMSGVAADGIGEDNIIERNAVIAFDIDAQDNPAIYDWEAVKAAISRSPFVGYVGLSTSGLGIFGLIPVKNAMKHKEHFDAISTDFANTTFTIMQGQDTEPTILHGINLDKAPSNIASKRFMSFDPKPYYNISAQVYTKTIEPIELITWKYTRQQRNGNFDVESFFKEHHIAYNVRERQGGLQYIVSCPWAHLHSSRSRAESAVFVYPDGRLGYKCMHGHCSDKHWHQFREYYEPDAYTKHAK
mgnify:FL=1